MKKRLLVLACVVAIELVACGGGLTSSSSLAGTAAVGSPIVSGAIAVKCVSGSPLSAVTDAGGAWHVSFSGQATPCAVQVSGGTIGANANTTTYHSIAMTQGIVNVTPLTNLLMANLTGAANPGVWFAGLAVTPQLLTSISQANVNESLAKLRTALSGLTPLSTFNPLTTPFNAVSGSVGDDILTALGNAIASSGVSYISLLGNASVPAYIMPTSGFGTALTVAYLPCINQPAAPTGASVVHAPPLANTQYIDNYITWNASANASYYEIFHSDNPKSFTLKVACTNLPGCTDTSAGSYPLSIGHEYYAVRAVNSCGYRSGLSNIATAPFPVVK